MFEYFRAYEDLRVKHEPLQLITPQFETPLPPLQPAVSELAFHKRITSTLTTLLYFTLLHFTLPLPYLTLLYFNLI